MPQPACSQTGDPARPAPAPQRVTLQGLSTLVCISCKNQTQKILQRNLKSKAHLIFQHTTPLVERTGINPNPLQEPQALFNVKHLQP